MDLGDIVTFKDENGNTLTGTIVNIYIVPKDYNLVDINVDGVIYHIFGKWCCTKYIITQFQRCI